MYNVIHEWGFQSSSYKKIPFDRLTMPCNSLGIDKQSIDAWHSIVKWGKIAFTRDIFNVLTRRADVHKILPELNIDYVL